MRTHLPQYRGVLTGPTFGPVRAEAPQKLVVLIHGYGASGDDLIGLAPRLAGVLPEAVFVSPDAPHDLPGGYGGRQWFPIDRLDPSYMVTGVTAALPTFMAFLEEALNRYGLNYADLILIGFSQGGMMALHAGLRQDDPPCAIVGLSTALPDAENIDDWAQCRPPVFLAHGDADPILQLPFMMMAERALKSVEIEVESHIYEDVGHGIPPQGLEDLAQFLARVTTPVPLTDNPDEA